MPDTLLTLRRLMVKHPQGMLIGQYQRHYVWGQRRVAAPDSATYLADCLIDAWRHGRTYFLQGITVHGDHLVDGQQRITFLSLMLRQLGYPTPPVLSYVNRPEASRIISGENTDDLADDVCEDVFFMRRTQRIIRDKLDGIDPDSFLDWLLDNVQILYISLDPDDDAVTIYRMMNGTKSPMQAPDLIKADIMRIASDIDQPATSRRLIHDLRTRYATEWESWVRWWNSDGARSYYGDLNPGGLDLLLRLGLRANVDKLERPLVYSEFSRAIDISGEPPYCAAKDLFYRLRCIQKRIEGAYTDTTAYNRIKAIILLQRKTQALEFLRMYFVDCSIDADTLDRYYRLSFLGMDIDGISRGDSPDDYFFDLYESLSRADVYHSEAKRDVFNLLLRLNIDEDIKLHRNFDFSVWDNRSLEHIYSKSKVWHLDEHGRALDGNDNPLKESVKRIANDPSYLRRDKIMTRSGIPLSEHCIGNLVLLYGRNNSEFGNCTFEQKKQMFLSPGNLAVFRSRNLLHSVCVFAGNEWTHKSIVANYHLTLKNLRLYYGYD